MTSGGREQRRPDARQSSVGKDIDPHDGLPLDDVGPWAVEKHDRLRKYVDISRGVRRRFLTGRSRTATYIDLFCGSGKARIRGTDKIIDGSPLVAYHAAIQSKQPFTEIHLADIDQGKCNAAAARIAAAGGIAKTYTGRAERVVRQVVKTLNPHGLHFAFLDPYNLDLPYSVLQELSSLKHIDILVHVSWMDMKRNVRLYLDAQPDVLDRFAPGCRDVINKGDRDQTIRRKLFEHWLGLIRALNLQAAEGIEPVRANKNQELYWLVFISRHLKAAEFWDKIRNASAQGRFSL